MEDLEVRSCAYGKGLYATRHIRQGELIWWHEEGKDTLSRWSRAAFDALPAVAQDVLFRLMYQTGPDEFSAPIEFAETDPFKWPTLTFTDRAFYMNHSCDANVVFEGDLKMVAFRDIWPGEQVTFDYATSEETDEGDTWECMCGANHCRRNIRGTDWMLPAVQLKYKGHFSSHIQEKIDASISAGGGAGPA